MDKLSYDYLKHTAYWQDWSSSYTPNPSSLYDKLVGRFYWVNWQITASKPYKAILQAWFCPILVDKKSTKKERLKAQADGFEDAWKQYKKELKKTKSISIAPARQIPKEWKDIITFYG